MVKKISFLFFLFGIMAFGLNAQTVPSPIEVSLNIEPVNQVEIPDNVIDTLTNPMDLISPSDSVILSISMLLVDTNTVSKIHIKLGTSNGASDLLDYTYVFDNFNPGGNLSYYREGGMVRLGTGTFLNTGVFHCEIKLEDGVGNFSEIVTTNSDQ